IEVDDYIYPNQELLIPRTGVQIYITKENDTLKDMTRKFGTSAEKLTMMNENIYLLPEQLLVFKKENFL
ncbi:MAG: LysM peptidoglycan-binding domain-containing protein, partial [Lachnospiraceae bacterium]|nr:LysM peptidoglycan-binding domain-containing protein [Lachnospiraceae bacterium]